jgi:hypothetical protein
MAQRREGAQAVMDDEEWTLGQWVLMALQVLAMALSIAVCAQIYTSYALGIPERMCIEGAAQ